MAGPRHGGEGLRVRGRVQGVGFRPAVWRLAREEGLTGEVHNDGAGVHIEIWGPAPARARFRQRLTAEAPPLARIDAVEPVPTAAAAAPDAFRIAESRTGPANTGVVPDAPVCPACLAELFDPADRRYRYPFLNCTHCGPRYTITDAVPYDRPNTAMADFALCPDCRAEYTDPADRRFHAQPIACPACGPRLRLRRPDGTAVPGEDPVAGVRAHLEDGAVVAIKGIGGFHLAVDARNRAAVERLRARKNRGGKPFALMAANAASLRPWATVDPAAAALLESPARPVTLLPKTEPEGEVAERLAPGMAWLGAMLPYAPVHYLLFHEAAGRPAGTDWLAQPQALVLVMTSANPGGEPLVTDGDEAVARLGGIADVLLDHDRPIRIGCDDGVVRPGPGGRPIRLRRGRGEVPDPVPRAASGPPVLATGAWLNNTVCLTRADEAFVSQHIGDLANRATIEAMEAAAAHLERLLDTTPAAVACDRHPDFPSTRFAERLAAERGIPMVPVQHHHAHIAAVAAEHGLEGPVLGLALDGVGLGDDGGLWGGELLRVAGADYRRLGSLAPLPLPGGDRAAREPWRMAAAALHTMGRGAEIPRRIPDQPGGEAVAAMLARGVNCPVTSSAGRLFDAAAGLLGVRHVAGFEGQAAMELESRAVRHGPAEPLAEGFRRRGATLDFAPLLAYLADGPPVGAGAAVFHATVAAGLAAWTAAAAEREGVNRVALGGGCWANHLLSGDVRRRLEAVGLSVYTATQVPPGDGGLSLGQAWVTGLRMRSEPCV